MPITPEQLAERLKEADRVRAMLRRATIEMQAVGRDIRRQREAEKQGERGPERPDDCRAPRR